MFQTGLRIVMSPHQPKQKMSYSMSATGGIALAEKDKNSSKTNHGP